MTSPSAQKAAGEIATRAAGRVQSECIGTQTGAFAWKEAASIIQQAITEAVDAAVAKERTAFIEKLRRMSGKCCILDCEFLMQEAESLEAIMGDK